MNEEREKSRAGTTEDEKSRAGDSASSASRPEDGRISIEDFSKIQLRTAKVLAASPIEGADRLLKLRVSLGHEERQLVAGIKTTYAPDELVGKTIVVVANLKPAKLRGLTSEGMLLAATTDDGPVLATFEKEVPPGSPVK